MLILFLPEAWAGMNPVGPTGHPQMSCKGSEKPQEVYGMSHGFNSFFLRHESAALMLRSKGSVTYKVIRKCWNVGSVCCFHTEEDMPPFL